MALVDDHEPDFIVVGDRVALGPLRPDLAGLYARWWNQAEVRDGFSFRGVASAHSQGKWVQENLERGAKHDPEVAEFTAYARSDASPVGVAGLFDIVHAHGRAK